MEGEVCIGSARAILSLQSFKLGRERIVLSADDQQPKVYLHRLSDFFEAGIKCRRLRRS